MAEFIVTPTQFDYIKTIIRNPNTGFYSLPELSFNISNPYWKLNDPVNDDPKYQKTVVKHFYTRLVEKWLYRDPEFRQLTKYFVATRKDDNVKVSLVNNIDNLSNTNIDPVEIKYILKYVEKVFVTRKLVESSLRQYVRLTNIKWYDLFNASDILKELFAHKLKKLIISTIIDYQESLQTKNKTKK